MYTPAWYICVCQTEDTEHSLWRHLSTVFGILFSLEAALFSPLQLHSHWLYVHPSVRSAAVNNVYTNVLL